MELDELKNQLRDKLAADHATRSANDIAVLLSKRTSSITSKLKRSLWIEIISCIVIMPVFLYLAFTLQMHAFRIYFLAFTVVFLPLLCILIFLLRRTQQLSAPSLPVKENLVAIVKLMNEFMRRYFQFTMLLIPVCFIFIFLLIYIEKHSPAFQPSGHGWFTATWQIYAFMGAYVLLLTVFIYKFTKWYLRKLYGKYVEQLRECIAELEGR